MMKLTFLGTGTSQGVPVIGCHCHVCQSNDFRDKRLRTSASVSIENHRFIIDIGPDFRQQMLRERIVHFDAILSTHGHKDHLGGLDDVRAFNYFHGKPADVYASAEVQRTIKKEFAYAFSKDPYPGVPVISLHKINYKPFEINGVIITPLKVLHYREDHFIHGFRIGDITYITDAIHIPDKEKEKIRGSKILILNALRKKKHYSHFNLDEAIELMHELRPEQGYLTHISHQMGLHEEVEAELPPFIRLAYDGLTIAL